MSDQTRREQPLTCAECGREPRETRTRPRWRSAQPVAAQVPLDRVELFSED
jgi:hypothetical protein